LLTPTGSALALVGAKDDKYTFTIDPSSEQSLEIGPNHLDIPANAIRQHRRLQLMQPYIPPAGRIVDASRVVLAVRPRARRQALPR